MILISVKFGFNSSSFGVCVSEGVLYDGDTDPNLLGGGLGNFAAPLLAVICVGTDWDLTNLADVFGVNPFLEGVDVVGVGGILHVDVRCVVSTSQEMVGVVCLLSLVTLSKLLTNTAIA